MDLIQTIQGLFPILENYLTEDQQQELRGCPLHELYTAYLSFGDWMFCAILFDDAPVVKKFHQAKIWRKEEMFLCILYLFHFHLRTNT